MFNFFGQKAESEGEENPSFSRKQIHSGMDTQAKQILPNFGLVRIAAEKAFDSTPELEKIKEYKSLVLLMVMIQFSKHVCLDECEFLQDKMIDSLNRLTPNKEKQLDPQASNLGGLIMLGGLQLAMSTMVLELHTTSNYPEMTSEQRAELITKAVNWAHVVEDIIPKEIDDLLNYIKKD